MGALEGKVAIVTGAGSIREGVGNGKAVAVRFAREGARVFAIDRNPEALDETVQLILGEGGTVAAGVGDISKAEECRRLVQERNHEMERPRMGSFTPSRTPAPRQRL
jgi:NAD(P)-dependent dehydrogenase (short-subunit alcohol dehydrogenase family)